MLYSERLQSRLATVRSASLAALIAAGSGSELAAQTCEDGLPPFASLGIGQFECVGGPCAVSLPDADAYRHSFSTEPSLHQIARRGPAAGHVEDGDVLVAVNDRLITTVDGGAHLGSLPLGESAKLTLRRGGHEIDVRVTPESSCDFPGLMVRSGEGAVYAYGTGSQVRAWASGDSSYVLTGDAVYYLDEPHYSVVADLINWVHADSANAGYIVHADTINAAYLTAKALHARAVEATARRSVAQNYFAYRDAIQSAADQNIAWDSARTVSAAYQEATRAAAARSDSVLGARRELTREATRVREANTHLDSPGRLGLLRPPVELGVELSCGDCGFRLQSGRAVFRTDEFPVIVTVESDGPGDEAGIEVGDVILSVAGRAITAGQTLGALRVGEVAPIEVRRGDRVLTLSITPRASSARRQRW